MFDPSCVYIFYTESCETGSDTLVATVQRTTFELQTFGYDGVQVTTLELLSAERNLLAPFECF